MKNLLAAVRAGDTRKLERLLPRRGGCTRQEFFTLKGALDARPEYDTLKSHIEELDVKLDALENRIDDLEELDELDEILPKLREELDALDEIFHSLENELYELKRPIATVISSYVRRPAQYVEPSFKYVDPEVHALREAGRKLDAQNLKRAIRFRERSQKKAGLPSSRPPKIRVEKPWPLHKLRGMPLAQLLNIIATERALRQGETPSKEERKALNELELFLMGKAGYSPTLRIPKEWDRLWRIRMGWRQAK